MLQASAPGLPVQLHRRCHERWIAVKGCNTRCQKNYHLLYMSMLWELSKDEETTCFKLREPKLNLKLGG